MVIKRLAVKMREYLQVNYINIKYLLGFILWLQLGFSVFGGDDLLAQSCPSGSQQNGTFSTCPPPGGCTSGSCCTSSQLLKLPCTTPAGSVCDHQGTSAAISCYNRTFRRTFRVCGCNLPLSPISGATLTNGGCFAGTRSLCTVPNVSTVCSNLGGDRETPISRGTFACPGTTPGSCDIFQHFTSQCNRDCNGSGAISFWSSRKFLWTENPCGVAGVVPTTTTITTTTTRPTTTVTTTRPTTTSTTATTTSPTTTIPASGTGTGGTGTGGTGTGGTGTGGTGTGGTGTGGTGTGGTGTGGTGTGGTGTGGTGTGGTGTGGTGTGGTGATGATGATGFAPCKVP